MTVISGELIPPVYQQKSVATVKQYPTSMYAPVSVEMRPLRKSVCSVAQKGAFQLDTFKVTLMDYSRRRCEKAAAFKSIGPSIK